MYFVAGGRYLLGGLLFIIAMLGFNAAIVIYNSYLPQISTEDRRDKLSSRGFASAISAVDFCCAELSLHRGHRSANRNLRADGRPHLAVVRRCLVGQLCVADV